MDGLEMTGNVVAVRKSSASDAEVTKVVCPKCHSAIGVLCDEEKGMVCAERVALHFLKACTTQEYQDIDEHPTAL